MGIRFMLCLKLSFLALLLLFLPESTSFASGNIDRMIQSTVRIFVLNFQGGNMGSGSGFVVGDGRHVVTNWHVIDSAITETGGVIFTASKETGAIKSKVLWFSENKDLAVLELEKNSKLPPVKFCIRKFVSVGDKAIAVGFPGIADDEATSEGHIEEMLDRIGTLTSINSPILLPSATNGTISKIIDRGNGRERAEYQTDASINPGNSGGPLFNEYGDLIGINVEKPMVIVPAVTERGPGIVRIPSGEGVGKAIQADELLPELKRLNIPYKTATPGVARSLNRLWNNEPLIVILGILILVISLLALYMTMTKQGKEIVEKTRGYVKSHTDEIVPELHGVSGTYAGNVIELNDVPVYCGRDPGASQLVFINDTFVSSRHCSIYYDKSSNRYVLEDSWSTNGTYYSRAEDCENFIKAEPGVTVYLKSGDRFYIGKKEAMFEVHDSMAIRKDS